MGIQTEQMITLRKHQRRARAEIMEKLAKYNIAYVAGEVRVGKTLTALVACDDMGYKKGLFTSRKNALPSIKDDIEMLSPSTEWTVINYESLHKVDGDFDVVVVDEAHNLGGFPKKLLRWKKVRKKTKGLPIIFCSGTPTPESYSQIYHQFALSDWSPWAHYKNFYAWARDYVNVKQKWITGRLTNDYTDAYERKIKMDTRKYFVVISQDEAGITEKIQEHKVRVRMTPEQQKYYKQIDEIECIPELNVTVSNSADKINKLSQICGGSIIDDDGNAVDIPSLKVMRIQRMFLEKGLKIAIFYKYRAERDYLARCFNTTSDPKEFQESDGKVFIGQVTSVREGVKLDTADCLVFYNIDFSAVNYWQARGRIQSSEREKEALVYWMITDGGIEDYVMMAVENKKNFTSKYYKRIKGCQN